MNAASERMRRMRARQRDGVRRVTIEVMESLEVGSLVRHGFLKPEDRADPEALSVAIYAALMQTLDFLDGKSDGVTGGKAYGARGD